MIVQDTTVLYNRLEAPGYYRMGLSCTAGFDTAKPGQFVMVRVGIEARPLLRRPFSLLGLIHERGRVAGIEILYKVVGEGTKRLSRYRQGETLSLLGPLGNAFLVPDTCRRLVLVAGGGGGAAHSFFGKNAVGQKNETGPMLGLDRRPDQRRFGLHYRIRPSRPPVGCLHR